MSIDRNRDVFRLKEFFLGIETKPTWSEWGPWGDCSQSCNGGERTRYRTCQNTPSDCQKEVTCKGENKQIEPCNTGRCCK